MVKPKIVERYIGAYLGELSNLVLKVPQEKRVLLPEHVLANQEIRTYLTTKTGIVVDYLGIRTKTTVSFEVTRRSFDECILPPMEGFVPPNQGELRLKPLKASSPNEPTVTVKLMGSMQGIVLFRIGQNHLFAYDNLDDHFGRYTIFNIYIQRQYSSIGLRSRYVRYAEFYPDRKEMFTLAKAEANARKVLADYLGFVETPEMGPVVQKYVQMGDAIHQLKENSVIVLGKDTGPEAETLRRIRDELRTLNYNAFLAREEKDIPGQSPEEKVKLLTLMSKFAVMEDSTASGHIAEYEYCKTNRVVLALLRKPGRGSTWMIGDTELVDVNFIKTFHYDDSNLHEILRDASSWAEDFVSKRKEAYGQYFR